MMIAPPDWAWLLSKRQTSNSPVALSSMATAPPCVPTEDGLFGSSIAPLLTKVQLLASTEATPTPKTPWAWIAPPNAAEWLLSKRVLKAFSVALPTWMAPPSVLAAWPGPLVKLLTNWQPWTVTRAPPWISRAPPETVAELFVNVQLLNCTTAVPLMLKAPPPVGV